MPVSELMVRMDSREFTEWAVFDKIEREAEEDAMREMKRKAK